MGGITLHTPLRTISGINPRFLKYFEKLGIRTVRELLWHFPTRYEDFSETSHIADLVAGQQTTVQGMVQNISLRRSWRKRLIIVEALISDETGSVRAVWFNQPYVKNVLRSGRLANFSGKVSLNENEIYLNNPTYELLSKQQLRSEEETRHTGRLVPIYPETRGLTSKGIRMHIDMFLKNTIGINEWIPEDILDNERLPNILEALHDVHFPESIEMAMLAKKRFAFEDLFLLQLLNITRKIELSKKQGPRISADLERVKTMLTLLPFELTLSQKNSLWEIVKDLGKSEPMNRLLQGDVGSGKTVIAAIASFLAAEEKFQTAFLAPTEVLARQHFETMKRLLHTMYEKGAHESPALALLTAHEAKIFYGEDLESSHKKAELTSKIQNGEIMICVGTHALIERGVQFKNLGLAVVDEQHRFGVAQRAALTRNKAVVPHFLSMSATPIPRTLMMTVFGDLDISLITELPKGRKAIVTKVVAPENRMKAYAFIRENIRRGRQAFVICPRIEKPEEKEKNIPLTFKALQNLEVKSVKEEFEKLSKKIFPDLKVGMLHGQMKAMEKHHVMDKFKNGEIHILVSTSVIEVGVDVPNATIMMIEGSERFGLAQLYQFRGRVGRGVHQSFCFLFTESNSKSTEERLNAIVKAKNGFELAEFDLKLRGPGQFLGEAQTGLPDLAMRTLEDVSLVKSSRDAAQNILEKDPSLARHGELKERLREFEKNLHLE